jgi:hypothetical protein
MPKSNRNWLTVLCEAKRPRYIDGKEIPNWQQGPSLLETVNYLGAKGWMLLNGSALWVGQGKLTFIRPQRLVIQCEEKRPRYINGQEIPNWQQGPTVSETVNYLWMKGWLLRCDPSVLQRGSGELTFLRPKP